MVDAVIFLIYGLTWCIGVTTITKTKNATTTVLRKIEIIYVSYMFMYSFVLLIFLGEHARGDLMHISHFSSGQVIIQNLEKIQKNSNFF